ncbi:MAG TPA: hypothetical protein VMV94_02580 [Phycisphaerae bacterium]|nr:hypothetical protein [Phycisphaerae bacterium]
MAMESACKLQVGRDHYDGKARMEVDHIDFAGSTKYRFRLSEIRSPRQEDEVLLFDFHGNPVSIRLSSARAASNWIDYMLHPQTLVDKLGIKEGHRVRVMNLDDNNLLELLQTRNATIVSQPAVSCDTVMLGIERPSELRQIEDLSETLRPDGAIWVVLPKSVRTVTKANVCAAAREAGLSHVEVVDYSESQAAYKIIRPAGSK